MNEAQLRQSVIKVAETFLGATTGDSKHKELVDTYNKTKPLARGYKLKYTDSWCDGGLSAWFIMADLVDLIGTEVGVPKHIDIFKSKKIWVEDDGFVPKPADIIVYDWNDKGIGDDTTGASHIGLVVSVEGSMIKVIEANKGTPGVCAYRDIPVNGRYIRGFATPDYASKVVEEDIFVEVTLRVLKNGLRGEDVRSAQQLLIAKGYRCGVSGADGIFGGNTKNAVKRFQKAKKLVEDGIIGIATWSALLSA